MPQQTATLVLDLVAGCTLRRAGDGSLHIENEPGTAKTVAVGSEVFKGWISDLFHRKHGKVPGAHAVRQVTRILLARAVEIPKDETSNAPFEALSDVEDADSEKGPARGESQTDALLKLTEDIELFHNAAGLTFARFESNGHYENYPIRSKHYKRQLSLRYFHSCGGALGSTALESVLSVHEARGLFEAEEQECHLRVAERDGHVYIDLANDAWEAIDISRLGWELISSPPVRFWRSRGMLALPTPTRGTPIDALKPFVNVSDDDGWRLLVGWLIGAVRPNGPYAVLLLQGGQGTAKSSLSRICRGLLDPSTAPLRRLPRSEHDLAIAANNARVLSFDNVSGVLDWTSDALCTVATGGGLATRELYSDSDECLFSASRPMIINGIDDIATRPDLADRSVMLVLEPISDEKRLDEDAFWSDFAAARPGILGALFDIVSGILVALPSVRLAKAPRMADFAKWVTAAEPSLGWSPSAFVDAYERNRSESIEVTFESDLVAQLIDQLLGEEVNACWTGSATTLYAVLRVIGGQTIDRHRKWPKAPNALSKHIKNRAVSPLAYVGIEVTMSRTGKGGDRELCIKRVAESRAVGAVTLPPPSASTGRESEKKLADTSSGSEPSAPSPPWPSVARPQDGIPIWSADPFDERAGGIRPPSCQTRIVGEGHVPDGSAVADGIDGADGFVTGSSRVQSQEFA